MFTVACVVKVVPSVDVWILYCGAYAVSQLIVTWLTCLLEPRSTCHHWPSSQSELQRVLALPSLPNAGAYSGSSSLRSELAGWPLASSTCVGGGALPPEHTWASQD